jgi:peptidoglycan/LPS O-acetylase OafA/YrhL
MENSGLTLFAPPGADGSTLRAASTRLAYLDGWRMAAIMLVCIAHLGLNREIGAFYESSPIGVVRQYGETGVLIFFFISGHVVSRACLAEVERSGGFSPLAFYVRRFFRIFPPLMFYLFVCLASGMSGLIDLSFTNFLSAALYLCNTTAPLVSCNWYVGHTWSLAYEEQFYWLFPVVFVFLELGRRPRLAVLVAVLSFAALPFFFTIAWLGKSMFFLTYALFFAGYAAAKHGERFVAALWTYRTTALLAAVLIAFLPRSVVTSFGADAAMREDILDYYRLFYVAAIPTMVLIASAIDPLRDILASRVVAYIGRASYSIYLWQEFCTGPIFQGLAPLPQLGLMAAMIVACLLLFPVELKIIDVGRALSKRIQARSPPARANSQPPVRTAERV